MNSEARVSTPPCQGVIALYIQGYPVHNHERRLWIYVIRKPKLTDGLKAFQLVAASASLDINSKYAYFLLCSHFADTSALVETDEKLIGFLGAYRRPDAPEALFIWQIAVDPTVRGQGLAGRMLETIVARPSSHSIRAIEGTVAPSNGASRSFFAKYAQAHGAALYTTPFLESAAFGAGTAHEAECLLHIGPLSPPRH